MIPTEYYTKFKSLIDELGELQSLLKYTCGASKEIPKREESQHMHFFLGSLNNERYEHVKETMLNTEPLKEIRWSQFRENQEDLLFMLQIIIS